MGSILIVINAFHQAFWEETKEIASEAIKPSATELRLLPWPFVGSMQFLGCFTTALYTTFSFHVVEITCKALLECCQELLVLSRRTVWPLRRWGRGWAEERAEWEQSEKSLLESTVNGWLQYWPESSTLRTIDCKSVVGEEVTAGSQALRGYSNFHPSSFHGTLMLNSQLTRHIMLLGGGLTSPKGPTNK